MSLGDIAETLFDRSTSAGKNVLKSTFKASPHGIMDSIGSGPRNLLTSIFKESANFIGANANDIAKWGVRKAGNAVGTLLKLGWYGLMLVPIPLPGRPRSIASLVGLAKLGNRLIAMKAGDQRSFKDIMTSIRENAQQTATGRQAQNSDSV